MKAPRPKEAGEKMGPRGLRTQPARAWPDDCPACATRMAFHFPPAVRSVRRVCPACGVTVTERQALAGTHTPAPLNLKKAA